MSFEYDSYALQICSVLLVAGGGVYAWRRLNFNDTLRQRYGGYGTIPPVEHCDAATNTSPPRDYVSQNIQCDVSEDLFECVGDNSTDIESGLATTKKKKGWGFSLW